VLVSCRLSPAGIRFLDILFPPENSALLTVGLPARHQGGPDSVGVPMFRTHEMRPGWVPPLPRGRRCPPDQRSLSDRRLPLPNGQPYTPLKPPTGGAADNGAYEDSLAFTRPVFPSPVAPGWNGSASAFTLGFAPRSYPRRTPGRGRSHGHWTGSHPLPTSNRRDHSSRATSRRTAALSFTRLPRQPGGGGFPPPLGHAAPRGARCRRPTGRRSPHRTDPEPRTCAARPSRSRSTC
jgi:hypothetical protein